ncbi:glutathione S-transferase [Lipomyces oligophaga]|uniref:glutathione S-transferase n=1 Tax=Lipomyces oligophaga TaxID=45792 RepID=UPI0034CECAB2
MSAPDLTVYTAPAPNGIKITAALEYLGLPYNVRTLALSKMEQKEPWYLEINPNGRIPALVDNTDGKNVHLMESGAILLYLTDKYDPEYKLSYPAGTKEYYEVLEWTFWQVGGIGPMQGQALHFLRYCATDNKDVIAYGFDRYKNEVRRLYSVLESRLIKQKTELNSQYVVGDHISIADIIILSWVLFDTYTDIDSNEFPAVLEWQDRISSIPSVKKGLDTPSPLTIKELAKDAAAVKALAETNKGWIKDQLEAQKK